MSYLGNNLQASYSVYRLIDNISSNFNGSTTSFALTVNGFTPVPFPVNEQNVLISVGGVPQKPDPTGAEGFKFSGTNIVFSSAPKTGEAFWGVVLAGADYVNVGVSYPDGTASAPSITFNSTKTTGVYLAGSSTLGFTTAGILRSTIDSNGNFSVVSTGSATAPAVAVGTGTTYAPGIYSSGTDQLAFSTGGAGQLFINASGNIGVGGAPSAWVSSFKAIEFSGGGIASALGVMNYAYNCYLVDAINWVYKGIGYALLYKQVNGYHMWFNSAIGTVGSTVAFTTAMTLDPSSRLSLGIYAFASNSSIRAVIDNSNGGGIEFSYNNNGGGAIVPSNGGGLQFFTHTGAVGSETYTQRMLIDGNGFASYTGSIGRGSPVTKTTSFTLGVAENWVICNGSGSITATLPAASAWTGREIMIKTIAAFTVVSASSNVVPLAGGSAGTAILAATAGKYATLVSDGTNWIIMQAN